MTLPASGVISLSDVNTELGKASTALITMNDADARALANVPSGQISMSDFYGKSALSISYLTSTQSNSALTTYTFSGLSFGTEDANRRIIVAIGAYGGIQLRTISSVTIGGVTATALTGIDVASSSSYTFRTAIYEAAVPTGITGNVVVTFSGGMADCGVDLYRRVGGSQVYAQSTGSLSTTTTTVSLTPSSGYAVSVAAFRGNVSGKTVSWTNATKNTDRYFDAIINLSSASGSVVGTVSATISSTSGLSANALSVASWA